MSQLMLIFVHNWPCYQACSPSLPTTMVKVFMVLCSCYILATAFEKGQQLGVTICSLDCPWRFLQLQESTQSFKVVQQPILDGTFNLYSAEFLYAKTEYGFHQKGSDPI